MIKELIYNGHTANPSDYASADGDLSLSMGSIMEDGALRPVLRPQEERVFPAGAKIMYIHETTESRHFLFTTVETRRRDERSTVSISETVLYWSDAANEKVRLRGFDKNKVHQVTSIGNSMLVLADDGTHYFLWKGEGYLYLGTKMPELPLSFGLRGVLVESDKITAKIPYHHSGGSSDHSFDYDKDALQEYKNQKLATANKLLAEHVTGRGRFCFPFFVRYAYRLYDQTLTKHSAPILMYASRPELSAIYADEETSDFGSITANTLTRKYKLKVMASVLDFCAKSQNYIDSLEDWKDIIQSVDIFVSAPIYNYDTSGHYIKTESGRTSDYESTPCGMQYFVGRMIKDSYSARESADDRDIRSLRGYYRRKIIGAEMKDAGTVVNDSGIVVPARVDNSDVHNFDLSRDADSVLDDIRNCCNFYFLKSYPLDEIPTDRTVIDVAKDYLQSLVAREVMTDDYDSHDNLSAVSAYSYNSRIHLYDMRKELFEGFDSTSLFQFTDGYYKDGAADPYEDYATENISVVVFIRQDNKEVVVQGGTGSFGYNSQYSYFYYPNSNAYQAEIRLNADSAGTNRQVYRIPLKKHDFLNGAYFFGEWKQDKYLYQYPDNTRIQVSSTSARTVTMSNRIYVSLVNNPFSFPASSISSVGTGRILKLAIAQEAMSPSQFGQFPMYAFTSEGVWALSISSEGKLNPAQPITDDVLINPEGIVSIDSSVIFSTARGLMQLSGSTSKCISDSINAADLFSLSDLPKCDALMKVFEDGAEAYDKFNETKLMPFLDYISGSMLLYDYVHQHILMFNPEVSYAYVYSLKSGRWGMAPARNFKYVLPSIGINAYAVYMRPGAVRVGATPTGPMVLYDYARSGGERIRTLVLTRPLKFEQVFDFKTIDTVIQRGRFRSDGLQQILYGSNDFEHWHIVWGSKDRYMRGFSGTPYKAYRIAFASFLSTEDNVYGCTIQYRVRRINQLR